MRALGPAGGGGGSSWCQCSREKPLVRPGPSEGGQKERRSEDSGPQKHWGCGRDGSLTLFALTVLTKKGTISKNSQNVKFLRKAGNMWVLSSAGLCGFFNVMTRILTEQVMAAAGTDDGKGGSPTGSLHKMFKGWCSCCIVLGENWQLLHCRSTEQKHSGLSWQIS